MRSIVFAFWLALLPGLAHPQSFEGLMQPGTIGLMRHALAPGTGNPAAFDLADCMTQRNLSPAGREQARRTGAALRAAGVAFDAVWTSQWCRARETAELLDVGPVREVPALNSHFAGRGDRTAQTAEVLRMLDTVPAGQRVLLVSHQVNISALTREPTRSGEIIAARRGQDGRLEVVGSDLIAP